VIGEKNSRAALRTDQVTTFPLPKAAKTADDYAGPRALQGFVIARYWREEQPFLLIDPPRLLEAMRSPAAATA